jgi:hypothetical protein
LSTLFSQTEADFTVDLTADYTGVVITGYTGNARAVNIPSTLQGMPVKEIGIAAFQKNETITSVVIPQGVVAIRPYAFSGCSKLASIKLPSTLSTIGDHRGYVVSCYTFAHCISLTDIVIPRSVVQVGLGAFYGCTALASVTLPASLKVIAGETFYGCTKLTSIVIPNGVTRISGDAFVPNDPYEADGIGTNGLSWGAFEGCSALASVTLPSTIDYVGYKAFRNCTSLTTVTIPDSVRKVDNITYNAFGGCSRLTLASKAALRRLGYTGDF